MKITEIAETRKEYEKIKTVELMAKNWRIPQIFLNALLWDIFLTRLFIKRKKHQLLNSKKKKWTTSKTL